MHRAFGGDLHQLRAMFCGQFAGHFDFNIDSIEHAFLRFALFAISCVDARMPERDRDFLQRQLFPARVEANRHGGANAQRCEQIIVRIGTGPAAACAYRLISEKVMFTCNNFLPETMRITAHNDVRCSAAVLFSHSVRDITLTAAATVSASRAQDSRKRVAVTPDEEQLENCDYDCGLQPLGCHQNVKDPNIYDDGAENRKTERNEASDHQKQAADDLQAADDVNVAAGKKGMQIFTNYALREWRVRKEMQECVGTEENENESKKHTGNNGSDFHSLQSSFLGRHR
jgi:hypothetical protein